MTAVAAEAAVVVDNGRETSGETSLWHGAAAGAAARVDQLLRRISGLVMSDPVTCRVFGSKIWVGLAIAMSYHQQIILSIDLSCLAKADSDHIDDVTSGNWNVLEA